MISLTHQTLLTLEDLRDFLLFIWANISGLSYYPEIIKEFLQK